MPRSRAETRPKTTRHKRPELPRSEPIRSWSTLFTDGSAGSGAPGARSAADSVQRGVELGYRVIDEYIKQGAGFAAPFAFPGRQSSTGGGGPAMTPERMLQYASDFTSLWLDAMGTMMNNAGAMSRKDAAQGQAPTGHHGSDPSRTWPSSPQADAKAPGRLELSVRAWQPVSVILTLDDSFDSRSAVTVEMLESPRGKVYIDQVSIQPSAGGGVKLTLEVPSGTAKGRYSGAIIDAATKNPRGRVTVAVSESSAPDV